MVDIHAHIIPGVDDGPPSFEVSMALLRQGAEDGIKKVVATPHIMSEADYEIESEIRASAEELRQQIHAENLDIELLLGGELYLQPELNLENPLATLNQNGRYFLVEFPMSLLPDFVEKQFFETIPFDKVPIIAHPERYVSVMKNVTRAFEFVKKRALLQINCGSLLGRFGHLPKETAIKLMDANLVHFIASDCHHPRGRPLQLKETFQLVTETWGEERARTLFIDNPERALQGQDIWTPESAFDVPKPSLWQRLGFGRKR